MYERVHVYYRQKNVSRNFNYLSLWHIIFAVFCGNDNCHNIVLNGRIFTLQIEVFSGLAKHSVLHNRGNFIWLSGDVSDDHRERLPREWRGNKLKNKN